MLETWEEALSGPLFFFFLYLVQASISQRSRAKAEVKGRQGLYTCGGGEGRSRRDAGRDAEGKAVAATRV